MKWGNYSNFWTFEIASLVSFPEHLSKKNWFNEFYTSILGCTCDKTGTQDGNQCAHKPTGECRCKPTVTGVNCDECLVGYWNFGGDRLGCKGEFYTKETLLRKTTNGYSTYRGLNKCIGCLLVKGKNRN